MLTDAGLQQRAVNHDAIMEVEALEEMTRQLAKSKFGLVTLDSNTTVQFLALMKDAYPSIVVFSDRPGYEIWEPAEAKKTPRKTGRSKNKSKSNCATK